MKITYDTEKEYDEIINIKSDLSKKGYIAIGGSNEDGTSTIEFRKYSDMNTKEKSQ